MSRLNPLRHLRGKMTLTYTAVTGSVFIIFWLLLLWLILSLEDLPSGSPLSEPLLGVVVRDITPFVQASPPDQAGLQTYLDLWVSGDNLRIENDSGIVQAVYRGLDYVAVTDTAGNILAVEPQVFAEEQTTLPLSSEVETVFEDILAGEESFRSVDDRFQGEAAMYNLLALPEGRGGLVIVFGPQALENSIREDIAELTTVMSLFFLCGTAVMGTIFGWVASSGLVRRLRRVQSTVATWEGGDFSPRINDQAKDEIGQLGRDLNQMAQQLDGLITTKSELAAVEERNRLARDLHDTVKQQIFAANMNLSAARTVIHADPDAADNILQEVEGLTDQIQTELTDLIQALRPAALADQGLVAALSAFADGWSQRTGVPVDLVLQGERPLPLDVEQELYRVAQEALANVEKHAQAKQVIIKLSWQTHALTMDIQDDGIGFDSSDPTTGFGLKSMNDRLAALSGLVTVDSHPGAGTRVTAVVELNE